MTSSPESPPVLWIRTHPRQLLAPWRFISDSEWEDVIARVGDMVFQVISHMFPYNHSLLVETVACCLISVFSLWRLEKDQEMTHQSVLSYFNAHFFGSSLNIRYQFCHK